MVYMGHVQLVEIFLHHLCVLTMTSVFSPETDPWCLILGGQKRAVVPPIYSQVPMTLTARLSWMALLLMMGDRRSNSRWSELRETGTAQGQEESSVRVEGSIGWGGLGAAFGRNCIIAVGRLSMEEQ